MKMMSKKEKIYVQQKKVLDEQIKRCLDMLSIKDLEYCSDRTEFFKRAGALQNIPPEQALYGMLAKHLVSVADLCKCPEKHSLYKWNEKITDSLNYLLLLRVLISERKLK